MLIYSIDPGKTIGYSEYTTSVGAPYSMQMGSVRELLDRLPAPRLLPNYVVVCEDFRISRRTVAGKIDYTAIHLVGYLKYTYPLEIVLQPPSAKAFATDDKLKKLGWYLPGLPHANDSRRHLLYYLVNDLRDKDIIEELTS